MSVMEAPYQMHVCIRCGVKPKIIHKVTAADFFEIDKTEGLPRGKYQAICTCCLNNKSIRSADLFEVVRNWNKENPAKRY